MKEFAKMLMVLESNIKAIRPCTEAPTYLLIELRLNGQVNNILSCWDSSKRQGETKRAKSHPNLPQVKQITPYHYD